MISKCIECVVYPNCNKFERVLCCTLCPQQQTKSVKYIWITDRRRILALVNKVKLVLELEDIRESPKSKGDCHTTTDRKIIINIIYIYKEREGSLSRGKTLLRVFAPSSSSNVRTWKRQMLYGRHRHNNSQRDGWLHHCVYTPAAAAAAPKLRQTIHHNRHVLLTRRSLNNTLLCRFSHSWNLCTYDCIFVSVYVHLNV